MGLVGLFGEHRTCSLALCTNKIPTVFGQGEGLIVLAEMCKCKADQSVISLLSTIKGI